MFKFADTEIIDVQGEYALAHSEDCGEKYGTGYTVRHYPGQKNIHPYMDECDTNIDFADLASALAQLEAFPAEDHAALTAWLHEHLA